MCLDCKAFSEHFSSRTLCSNSSSKLVLTTFSPGFLLKVNSSLTLMVYCHFALKINLKMQRDGHFLFYALVFLCTMLAYFI